MERAGQAGDEVVEPGRVAHQLAGEGGRIVDGQDQKDAEEDGRDEEGGGHTEASAARKQPPQEALEGVGEALDDHRQEHGHGQGCQHPGKELGRRCRRDDGQYAQADLFEARVGCGGRDGAGGGVGRVHPRNMPQSAGFAKPRPQAIQLR